MTGFLSWLDHWQTLVSGVLAILAAGFGVWMLHRQMAQTEAHEQDRRRSRFVAARAVLPLTLSGVTNYASEMIVELANLLSVYVHTGKGPVPASFTPPRPPAELVASLKEAIEATRQPNVIALLSDIIGEMQTLSSRVGGLSDLRRLSQSAAVNLNLEEYTVQAARLYAMAGALFLFARREDEDGPTEVAWKEAIVALHVSAIRGNQYRGVYQIIERKEAESKPVWRYQA